MSDYNLDFLSEDIQNGLLKNNRVGMIRRTLKITKKKNGFNVFFNRSFILGADPFVILNVKWWLE